MRATHPEQLAEPALLSLLFGPIATVERERLTTPGFSGAEHHRLRVRTAEGASHRLVLKLVHLDRDMTARRTLDARGRETHFAAAPGARVWRALRSPYRAWAREPGTAAVLMDDLSDVLLPDHREPLERWQEDMLLAALARMHAAYWQHPGLEAPWLARAHHVEGMLLDCDDAPCSLEGFVLRERVERGWSIVRERLPGAVTERLLCRAADLRDGHASLPRTLVHGDAKVANFAVSRGEVWAFDWACAAAAPPSHDLGWYLAVNASRLTRPKEAVAARYRVLLEEALGRAIDETLWRRLYAHAIRAGARMLLWSKAVAAADGGEAAEREWGWWADALEEALAGR